MRRRNFLKRTVPVVAMTLAGCSTKDFGYQECYGDCEKVEKFFVNSQDAWESEYTELTIVFSESFSGEVVFETYSAIDNTNGYKSREVENVENLTIEFDKFKTHNRWKVFVEAKD